MRDHYVAYMTQRLQLWNKERVPHLATLDYARFILWNMDSEPKASAWNHKGDFVEGLGWVPSYVPDCKGRILRGNYVAHFSWLEGHYGHYMHDHMPTIAYLRAVVPPTTKFLLLNRPVTHKVLKFVDPDFYHNRIEWYEVGKPVHVMGELTVPVVDAMPFSTRHVMLNYLRRWLVETHPTVPTKRTVVFYTRSGSTDRRGGRVLEKNHERQVLDRIRKAMIRHRRPERLIVFNGQVDGKTMSVAKQYEIFRSAQTVIGPHGTGLGGNMGWTDPHPKDCASRVQLLEFIPGADSEQVQSIYTSHYPFWGGLPLDYHTILYTGNSTKYNTYVNLDDLDRALDAMWTRR